jgi:hypothetical protein
MLGKMVAIAVSLPDSASVAPLHRMRFDRQMVSLRPDVINDSCTDLIAYETVYFWNTGQRKNTICRLAVR